MTYQCDNCGHWFSDSSYTWESYHECPHCGAYDGQEEPELIPAEARGDHDYTCRFQN